MYMVHFIVTLETVNNHTHLSITLTIIINKASMQSKHTYSGYKQCAKC